MIIQIQLLRHQYFPNNFAFISLLDTPPLPCYTIIKSNIEGVHCYEQKACCLPSALLVAIVTSPMFLPTKVTSPARLFIMERREVPACEALIPLFAMRPMASAVSSAENPNAPAIGAQYLNVSPIMLTLVFALEEAAARISAK